MSGGARVPNNVFQRFTLDARINTTPAGFDPNDELPSGFLNFVQRLHREFTPRQRALVAKRAEVLSAAHSGEMPNHLKPTPSTTSNWSIDLPSWCADQRNQMTGPADDAELVVKMLNSGAPGVMLDLEDSMANYWPNLMRDVSNILQALRGALTYFDKKRDQTVVIKKSETVIWSRARGLHLGQAGVLKDEVIAASLFDVALIAYQVDAAEIKHPLSFYIPNSESAEEALWCAIFFRPSSARRAGRRAGSNAWRWSNQIRWPFRWTSSSTTCAITFWA